MKAKNLFLFVSMVTSFALFSSKAGKPRQRKKLRRQPSTSIDSPVGVIMGQEISTPSSETNSFCNVYTCCMGAVSVGCAYLLYYDSISRAARTSP